MARRMSVREANAIVKLIIVGLPIFIVVSIISKLFEVLGVMPIVVLVMIMMAGYFLLKYHKSKTRKESLLLKYRNPEVVEKNYWRLLLGRANN